MIIDTHCHVGLFKYEPLASLLFHMEANGVDKAVFIQYMGNTDNGYLLHCMNEHPTKFAAAMIVAPDDDGSQIRHWAERGIRGIRLSASFRGTGVDPLIHWATAAELGLVVSAPSTPKTLLSDEFRTVVKRFSNLHIVIEHLGGVGRGAVAPYTEFLEVMKLARYPNLSIKLPGFGEFCDLTALLSHRLPEDSDVLNSALEDRDDAVFSAIPPLADMTLDAFGHERVMWGSDYPPVSSREGYGMSLKLPQSYLRDISTQERDWIFGKTAAQVWGLS